MIFYITEGFVVVDGVPTEDFVAHLSAAGFCVTALGVGISGPARGPEIACLIAGATGPILFTSLATYILAVIPVVANSRISPLWSLQWVALQRNASLQHGTAIISNSWKDRSRNLRASLLLSAKASSYIRSS